MTSTYFFTHYMDKFSEKHPNHRNTLNDLKYDAQYFQSQINKFFFGSLAFTWGAIWLKTSTSGAFPVFAKRGIFFGTPRVVRHYFYSLVFLNYIIRTRFNHRLGNTLTHVNYVLKKEEE